MDHLACIDWPTGKASLGGKKRCTKRACLRTRSSRALLTRLGHIYTCLCSCSCVSSRRRGDAGGRRNVAALDRQPRALCAVCSGELQSVTLVGQQSAPLRLGARAAERANSQASTTGLDSSGLFPKADLGNVILVQQTSSDQTTTTNPIRRPHPPTRPVVPPGSRYQCVCTAGPPRASLGSPRHASLWGRPQRFARPRAAFSWTEKTSICPLHQHAPPPPPRRLVVFGPDPPRSLWRRIERENRENKTRPEPMRPDASMHIYSLR